ncbi:helix-turn-helix domain-containing protein [Aeromonas caviae]|uniref:helix-turn-helix domain-containing protein n=1 Tax=Aeromonas caviae TaxID=648 RepID=UPI002B4776A4|nr:transcriptional regulator [Aeromonas caviae]
MNISPIRNDADYEAALARIELLFDAPAGTPESDELDVLATLVEVYEEKHYPIAPPHPVEAIKFRMEQAGVGPDVLEKAIGHQGRVSEVLNLRRRLTLPMIRKLVERLHIPAVSLISEYHLNKKAPR